MFGQHRGHVGDTDPKRTQFSHPCTSFYDHRSPFAKMRLRVSFAKRPLIREVQLSLDELRCKVKKRPALRRPPEHARPDVEHSFDRLDLLGRPVLQEQLFRGRLRLAEAITKVE